MQKSSDATEAPLSAATQTPLAEQLASPGEQARQRYPESDHTHAVPLRNSGPRDRAGGATLTSLALARQ